MQAEFFEYSERFVHRMNNVIIPAVLDQTHTEHLLFVAQFFARKFYFPQDRDTLHGRSDVRPAYRGGAFFVGPVPKRFDAFEPKQVYQLRLEYALASQFFLGNRATPQRKIVPRGPEDMRILFLE